MSSQPGEKSHMMAGEEVKFQGNKSSLSKGKILLIVLVVIAIIVLIVGIVLIALAAKKKDCDGKEDKHHGSSGGQTSSTFCKYSEEAERIGLNDILLRVKKSYYENHPFELPTDPDATRDDIRKNYKAYNPTPEYIKQVTDSARKLLKEVSETKVDNNKLKPRERKALSQLKHYLKTVFGQPSDMNYYAGHWMMGPTFFCDGQAICKTGNHLSSMLKRLKPENVEDVNLIEKKLKTHKEGILRYMENLKMGKLYGMVYSQEVCVGSRNALRGFYMNIALKNETGVLEEKFVREVLDDNYFSNITEEMNTTWKNEHGGKSVKESLDDFLVENMGKPMSQLLRYMKQDHYRHCVPSNFSSGLATLPLDHVWVDGKENTSWPTNKMLPDGEKLFELNGTKAYSMIMPYYTTNDMTPDQVYKLGYEQLNKLYPQAVQAAKQSTGKDNETEAIQEFRIKLDSPDNYFNKDPFPANESDDQAYVRCSTIEGAKKYCPMRWKALQVWFGGARMAISLLNPKIVDMFYFAGKKRSTPNCPIEMRPSLNPSSGAQSYSRSDPMCLKPAHYYVPFFLSNFGPKSSEWTIGAHEAQPGHHLQRQGSLELFQDTCGGTIAWLDSRTYYTAFIEGWGLYAENPLISDDTDVYDGEPMRKYGMLKWQIWRAVRLIVDTGLHYKGMKRDEAMKMFKDYAWDNTDFTSKEVTRYQGWPGQATAYMIGRLGILKAREDATSALGEQFSLKDFHYQVLSQGSSPLAFLKSHINNYVECVKKPDKEGCSDILNPPKRTPPKDGEKKSGIQLHFKAKRHYI